MRADEIERATAALREVPLDPRQWEPTLKAAARACGASSAQLLSFGDCRFAAVTAPGFSSDDIAAFVDLGGADPSVNLGLRAVMASRPHDILVDDEYLPEGGRERDRLYNDFFRRFDGEYVASGTVARNAAATCNLNLFYPRSSGGMDPAGRRALEILLPRFSEAVRMTAWLETRVLDLSASAWEARDEAVFVCDRTGAVRRATRAAERLLGQALLAPGGRITCRDPDAADALSAALRRAARPWAPEAGRLVAQAPDGGLVLLDILPLPALSGVDAALALVCVSVVDDRPRLDAALLQAAFALTPAECAVAEELAQGRASAEIARRRRVSVETVNTQVKAIRAKTRVSSRAALTPILQGFVRRDTSAGRDEPR